jgi:hypothetical protein
VYIGKGEATVAERINITIPNALSERLQAVKGRLNVSKICQQAIEKAVTLEEINTKDIPGRDKLIKRLRMEKEESIKGWKETGFTDGKQDAQKLSYDDFQMLENDGEIPEETRDWVKENHFEYYERPNEESYFEGWIEAVLSVWNDIKNEV